MRSLVLLYTAYFLIYSIFLYIFGVNDITNVGKTYNYIILIGIQCLMCLLGGILATFIVPAFILFTISLGCFGVGVIGLAMRLQNVGTGYFWFNMVCISISFGLFKFIFIVILLDHVESKEIILKVGLWFIVENFSYIVIYLLLPETLENIYEITFGSLIVALIFGLFIIGKKFEMYQIDSRTIDIMKLIKYFQRRHSILVLSDSNSKKAIISISQAIVIMFFLVPYGICNSQEEYVYEYQSKGLKKPDLKFYAMKNNYWPFLISCSTIIIFWVMVLCCRLSKWKWGNKFYSSIKNQIIIGIIIMIMSTTICGLLETYRINRIISMNLTNKHDINESPEADFSVFYMTPQIILLGISEVLVVPACIELVYSQSWKSTKYLATAFVVNAIEIGGASDLISMVINQLRFFETPFKQSAHSWTYRVDYFLYLISFIAFFSLLMGMFLMKRFGKYFQPKIVNTTILEDEPSQLISDNHI